MSNPITGIAAAARARRGATPPRRRAAIRTRAVSWPSPRLRYEAVSPSPPVGRQPYATTLSGRGNLRRDLPAGSHGAAAVLWMTFRRWFCACACPKPPVPSFLETLTRARTKPRFAGGCPKAKPRGRSLSSGPLYRAALVLTNYDRRANVNFGIQ